MTSQSGYKTITIHILPNISRSKSNQIMKFGQLIECDKRDQVEKNQVENEARRLVSYLFLFFKKALYKIKASGLQISFNIFRYP